MFNTIKVIRLLRDKEAWHLGGNYKGCEKLIHKDGFWFYVGTKCVSPNYPDGKTITDSFLGFPLRWYFSFPLEKKLYESASTKG